MNNNECDGWIKDLAEMGEQLGRLATQLRDKKNQDFLGIIERIDRSKAELVITGAWLESMTGKVIHDDECDDVLKRLPKFSEQLGKLADQLGDIKDQDFRGIIKKIHSTQATLGNIRERLKRTRRRE